MKSATRLTVSTLGTMAGMAGIVHGIGETLQGNIAPEGLMILAWPGSELFRILNGEPAMTIVPSLLATGILAIIVSLAYILWATVLAEKKHSGLALILLSVVMLLVGAGFGSALVGMIVGLIATRMTVNGARWHTHLPSGIRHVPGRLWPWAYAASVIAWLSLMPGSLVLGYVMGADNAAGVVAAIIMAAFGTLLLVAFTGFAYDGDRVERRTDKAEKPGPIVRTEMIV